MTADLFLTQLEHCLRCLTQEEKENAMAYYREYLAEAGENADQAAEHLGSPQSVAEKILSEMREAQEEPLSEQKLSSPKSSAGNTALGILILLVTSPFWGTMAVLWLTLLFCLAVILLSLVFSAIFAPVQGISYLMNQLSGEGLWAIGSGLLCAGLALLLWKPMFLLCQQSTKAFFGFCRNSLQTLFRKDS